MPTTQTAPRRRAQTPLAEPNAETVAAQVAAAVAAFDLRVSQCIGAVSRDQYTTQALREDLGLPVPRVQEYTVHVTYTLAAPDATSAQTYVADHVSTPYALVGDGRIRPSFRTETLPDPNPPASPPTTVAGRAAAEAALVARKAALYRALVGAQQSRGVELTRVMRECEITAPPTETFRIMVPLDVTAFSEDEARRIARDALRDRHRDPARGQIDPLRVPAASRFKIAPPKKSVDSPEPDASAAAESGTP